MRSGLRRRARTIAPFDGPRHAAIIWCPPWEYGRLAVWAMIFARCLDYGDGRGRGVRSLLHRRRRCRAGSLSSRPRRRRTPPPPTPAGRGGAPRRARVTMSLAQAVATALQRQLRAALRRRVRSQTARYATRPPCAQFYPQLTPRYVHGEDEQSLWAWTRARPALDRRLRHRERPLRACPRTSSPAAARRRPEPHADRSRCCAASAPTRPSSTCATAGARASRRERGLELARQQARGGRGPRLLPGAAAALAAGGGAAEPRRAARACSARPRRGCRWAWSASSTSSAPSSRPRRRRRRWCARRPRCRTRWSGSAALLGRSPAEPIEPEATRAPGGRAPDDAEPLPILVQRALASSASTCIEARDQVDDARRSAALARQNLLPQLDLNLGVSPHRPGPGLRLGLAHRRPARQRVLQRVLPAGALDGPSVNKARRRDRRDGAQRARSPARVGDRVRGARGRARPGPDPQERRAAEDGGGGGPAAAPPGHAALPARPGQQLRRGATRRAAWCWRAARWWACSPATRSRAWSCCASPAAWTWTREFAAVSTAALARWLAPAGARAGRAAAAGAGAARRGALDALAPLAAPRGLDVGGRSGPGRVRPAPSAARRRAPLAARRLPGLRAGLAARAPDAGRRS